MKRNICLKMIQLHHIASAIENNHIKDKRKEIMILYITDDCVKKIRKHLNNEVHL